MCDLCMHSPHLTGCPNAPGPIPVFECRCCGKGIFNGDKYHESYQGPLCEECLEDMTALELLEYEGESIRTVESDEETDYWKRN